MTRKLPVFAVGLGSILIAQVAPKIDKSKPLGVCDVLRHPTDYDGKVVTIRGILFSTSEGVWFSGDPCPGVLSTDEHVWPSEIWVDVPRSRLIHVHAIDFTFDAESNRRAQTRASDLSRRFPTRCLEWTDTGLFETRQDWSRQKVVYPNGTTRFFGFGHGNEAPAQLIVKSVDDVAPTADCSPQRSLPPGRINGNRLLPAFRVRQRLREPVRGAGQGKVLDP